MLYCAVFCCVVLCCVDVLFCAGLRCVVLFCAVFCFGWFDLFAFLWFFFASASTLVIKQSLGVCIFIYQHKRQNMQLLLKGVCKEERFT